MMQQRRVRESSTSFYDDDDDDFDDDDDDDETDETLHASSVGSLDVSWPPTEEREKKKTKKPKRLNVDWEKTIKKNQTEQVSYI